MENYDKFFLDKCPCSKTSMLCFPLANSLFSNSPSYTLFAPKILHKPLFSNALGHMQCPQEHLITIVYAKFGGQTRCIMGNSKIEN